MPGVSYWPAAECGADDWVVRSGTLLAEPGAGLLSQPPKVTGEPRTRYMRSAKFIRVLAVCGIAAVGVGASAEGATIQAGGCSQSQVVSAINSAKDGDTVVVPAGNCTWTSTVTIDGKSITLQGAGIDSTVITDGIDSGGGAKPVLLSWITRNTGLSRLTGFTFNG